MVKLFYSPTHGWIDIDTVWEKILAFMRAVPDAEYRVSVGTDSQNFSYTKFVVAVVVHRVGKGAIFFRAEQKVKKITSLYQKIQFETVMSLEIANELAERFARVGDHRTIQVHADIGKNGPTNKYMAEITGWIRAQGFECGVKPNSLAASSVANRYSKYALVAASGE